MAKYGNFNYSEDTPVSEILAQYKEYRKKDLHGTVKQEEFDALKASLQEKEAKLSDYVKAERSKLIESAAKKVNSEKAAQLIKYTTLGDDFDYSDTAALEAAMTDTNKELFVQASDEAAKAKLTEVKVTPVTTTTTKASTKFDDL